MTYEFAIKDGRQRYKLTFSDYHAKGKKKQEAAAKANKLGVSI